MVDTNITYLRLALPSPLRRLFDYLPPKGIETEKLPQGIRVKVPFGRRILIGILIEVVTQTDIVSDKLKHAIEIIDDQPVLSPSILSLCQWVAQYYIHSLGDTLSWAMPSLLKQGKYPNDQIETFWCISQLTDLDDPRLQRAPRQKRALQILSQHPHGVAQKLLAELQIQLDTLKQLQKKCLIFSEQRQIQHKPHEGSWLIEPELLLNEQQQQVVSDIMQQHQAFHAFLLNGVTGSGKTEVFFHLIHQLLMMGKQVLVLIPEINLSPQTLRRFEKRFNARIAIIHSDLTDKERLDAWHNAKRGIVDIVIGTRSAIFTPMPRLGMIIVDEEHDNSYKQQDGLRYHARDVAIVRAKMERIPIVLGTATPSFESLHNANTGRYTLLTLSRRAGIAQLPTMQSVDVRNQIMDGGISITLQRMIANTLQAGQQALVFINRRGFAPTLLCHHCGWISHCPHCDARMTLHLQAHELRCHHCDYRSSLPVKCPSCHHVDLRPLGHGTQRTEERLRVLFPDWPVWRIDRDTTERKQAMQEIVNSIRTGEPGILVGTQMLAKGHHFPNVTLVAILDADNGLFSADFRASEKTAQLIIQVAGRSGRAAHPGKVLIQTQLPQHPLLQQLVQQGYFAFAKQALQERMQACLPPFTHMALLRAEAYKQEQLDDFLNRAFAQAELMVVIPDYQMIEVYDPVPALMERRAGRFRAQILVQSEQRTALHQFLNHWVTALDELPKTSQVRWSLDVDPIEVM